MKKIGLIIAVLALLQVVFVTTALADGPNNWDRGHGYGYNQHGYQNVYNSHPWWNKHYSRYYPNYHYTYNYYRWNHYNYGYTYKSWYGCNPCCRPAYYGYYRSNYRY